MSALSITEVVLKDEILNYTGEQFHTLPKDAKAFLEKQGIAIIPNVWYIRDIGTTKIFVFYDFF